jgi:predicted nucleic acid-binding protein
VAFLLDTNVAIRDGDPAVTQKVAALKGAVLISIVTRVELEGGVYREPAQAPIRRARLDAMLSAIPALAFDDLAAKTFGDIVASAGYAAEAARPDDRSSRSGTPGNPSHLSPGGLRRCARCLVAGVATEVTKHVRLGSGRAALTKRTSASRPRPGVGERVFSVERV